MAAMINTNIASLNAQRNLNTSQSSLTTSLQRLSSGLRINSAKDDAAGLAISERMSSQIKGNDQAVRNANDGISLAQTAEGDLAQIGSNLQRMRELAVQSSNATNSAADRAALNNEVQQLAAEIDRVSQNSSFNGVKLLDGTFTAQDFQVGANATGNDKVQIASIASARTASLGGVGTTYEAKSTSGATTAALAAGDLTLNGFQVGASLPGLEQGKSTASATQIAAAINQISSSTGVTATANTNTITGSAATAFTAIAADTFTINGVSIGAVAAGTNAAGQGANLAAAINKASVSTGVVATADASTGALSLKAADGRDISIGLTGTAADGTVAAANKATFLTQTGLATGVVGTQGRGSTTTTASGAFTIPTSAGGAGTIKFTIDGVDIAAATTIANPGDYTAADFDSELDTFLASGPGAGYSKTGSAAGGDLTITKADGTALTLARVVTGDTAAGTFAGGAGFLVTAAGAGTGTTAGVAADNRGTVTLTSNNSAGIVVGGANVARAGLTAGTTSATLTAAQSTIAGVNISTAKGASDALSTIDGALATISNSRASLGAYQNRFASVVASLQTTSENLTASRSRIQDTDFASETANLTRGQILQQAGTAMLAQANSLPQGVLALLRG